jgi:hypothetical protein
MMHAWGQEKRKPYRVLVETMKEKRPCGIPGIDGRIIIKMDIQEVGCENVKRFIWAVIAISGGILLT